MSEYPLVSIGMPLYNGARYLREALDSLLAQDYPHFEIVISDNASVDETEAICREYEQRDERISYHRAEHNHGAVWNFNRVFELACGKYFAWAAFDDLRAPQYVRRCVETLENEPRAVICSTALDFIDEQGVLAGPCPARESVSYPPVGPTVGERMKRLALSTSWYDFYGMMRRDVLAETRLNRPTWGFDVVLEVEMCLRGQVIVLPECLFFYRVFAEKTNKEMANTLGTQNSAGGIAVSYLGMAEEIIMAIWQAPIPFYAKWSTCRQFIWNFAGRNRSMNALIRNEAGTALKVGVRRRQYRKRFWFSVTVLAALIASRLRHEKHLLHFRFQRLRRVAVLEHN